MGLIKYLDKAFEKLNEYGPQMMEYVEKREERQMRSYEREQEKEDQVKLYKEQYSASSNQELKEMLNTETGLRKKAISLLLHERKFQINSYKELYSGIDSINLKIELKMLEQRATHYGEMQGHKLTVEDAELRKEVVKSVLRGRGEM